MRQHFCSNNKIKQPAYEILQEFCSSETSIKPPATEMSQRDFTSTATENQHLGTQASTTERANVLQHRSIAIQTPQSLLDPGRKAAAEQHYFKRQQKRRRKQADPNENCVAVSANDRSAAPNPTTTTKVIQSEQETGPSTSGTPNNSQPTTEVPLPETPFKVLSKLEVVRQQLDALAATGSLSSAATAPLQQIRTAVRSAPTW